MSLLVQMLLGKPFVVKPLLNDCYIKKVEWYFVNIVFLSKDGKLDFAMWIIYSTQHLFHLTQHCAQFCKLPCSGGLGCTCMRPLTERGVPSSLTGVCLLMLCDNALLPYHYAWWHTLTEKFVFQTVGKNSFQNEIRKACFVLIFLELEIVQLFNGNVQLLQLSRMDC